MRGNQIMIQVKDVVKQFNHFTALNHLNCTVQSGSIYGLIGSNGSGKSTLLRLICGVYQAERGCVEIDGENVYENPALKDKIFYLSDELYFLPQSNMDSMAKFYAGFYSGFSMPLYRELCASFPLDPKKKLSTFSKGMRRQAGIILALSCRPQVLLLDEAFDGLDPVIRNMVRKILVETVAKENTTVVIASHNLRELEDLCDHIGLLHKGGILLDKDLDTLRLNICKFHCAFGNAPGREAFEGLELLKFSKKGNLITFVAKGERDKIEAEVEKMQPLFLEAIPLTLEEIFIQEMEVAGYEFFK